MSTIDLTKIEAAVTCIWTSEIPTSEIRWFNGTLQQTWIVTEGMSNGIKVATKGWRDVAIVYD